MNTRKVGKVMDKKVRRFYTETEKKLLLNSLNGTKHEYLIRFLFQSGLRIGEVLGRKNVYRRDNVNKKTVIYPDIQPLRPKDIHFSENMISIQPLKRKLRNLKRETELRIISPAAMDTLKHQLILNPVGEDDPIWKVTRDTIDKLLKKHAKKLGIPRSHAHMMRHTFGTTMAENADIFDMKQIQEMMGHSSIDVTMQYIGDKRKRDILKDVQVI